MTLDLLILTSFLSLSSISEGVPTPPTELPTPMPNLASGMDCATDNVHFASEPANAWQYWYSPRSLGSPSYHPVTRAEFAETVEAVPTCLVETCQTEDHANLACSYASGPGVHVFGTWLVSDVHQIVTLRLVGDDGHSVFVDEEFVAGSGFGEYTVFGLRLVAHQPVRLEVVLHDSGGWWNVGLRWQPNGEDPPRQTHIEGIPNVCINATHRIHDCERESGDDQS